MKRTLTVILATVVAAASLTIPASIMASAQNNNVTVIDFDSITCTTNMGTLVDRGSGNMALQVPTGNGGSINPFLSQFAQKDWTAQYLQFYVKGYSNSYASTDNAYNMGVDVQIHAWKGDGKGGAAEDQWCKQSSSGSYLVQAAGSSDWQTMSQGEQVWVPKSFEGYIRVPLSQYWVNGDGATAPDLQNICDLSVWINGTDASQNILLDDFVLVNTTQASSETSSLNESSSSQTSNASSASSAPVITAPADTVMDFSLMPDAATALLNSTTFPTASIVDNGSGLKVLAVPTGSGGSINPVLDDINTDFSGASYLQFYYKGNGTTLDPSDNAYNSGLRIDLHVWKGDTDGNAIEDNWWRMYDAGDWDVTNGAPIGRYYAKASGATTWTEYSEDTGTGSQVWLPKNFEGYVRVPLDHFTCNESKKNDGKDPTAPDLHNVKNVGIWFNGVDASKTVLVGDFKLVTDSSSSSSLSDSTASTSSSSKTQNGSQYDDSTDQQGGNGASSATPDTSDKSAVFAVALLAVCSAAGFVALKRKK